MKNGLMKPIIGCSIAAVLWTIMFSPWTSPHINFWVMMTCSGAILTTYSTIVSPGLLKRIRMGWSDIVLGVLLAAALWGVFWIGDRLSSLMFDFARPQVNLIYGMKEGENPVVLTLLMLFIIGPAEEIFWRGYIQNFKVQLHADHGSIGCRFHLGIGIPILPRETWCDHSFARTLGLRSIYLVPDLIFRYVRLQDEVPLRTYPLLTQ